MSAVALSTLGWVSSTDDNSVLDALGGTLDAEILKLSTWTEIVSNDLPWAGLVIDLHDSAEPVRQIRERVSSCKHVPLIALVPRSEFETGVRAAQFGATAVLAREGLKAEDISDALLINVDALDQAKTTASQASDSNVAIEANPDIDTEINRSPYVFVDPVSQSLFELAQRVARTDVPVLIQGATGTGKEVLAKVVRDSSARAKRPYVSVNCGAITESLAESMLFGHEKGSFTGASRTSKGVFEQAHGGTLFLDEIGEMAMHLQTKLLRVLQEKTLTRVGGASPIEVDVRVIAATNKNLAESIGEGSFREDLYFRLSAFKLSIPPLSSRKLDIAPLVELMLGSHGQAMGHELTISSRAMDELIEYSWPGNVRELDNVISRAVVFNDSGTIDIQDIQLEDIPMTNMREGFNSTIGEQPHAEEVPVFDAGVGNEYAEGILRNRVKASECDAIVTALRSTRNRKEAANRLGISPRTLRYKLKKLRDHGLNVPAAYER